MNFYQIGENIKKHRAFKGKKQEALAKEIGVSRIMLSRYENGRVKISIETLHTIATSLDIKLMELLDL